MGVFLQHSEFERLAFQLDWIASRMKNSAKMYLHLFTQTNENIRIFTQYRCHFRRDISNVVGCDSACSTASTPPPPIFLTFSSISQFSLVNRNSTPACVNSVSLILRGVRAAFSHSLVRSTRVLFVVISLSFHTCIKNFLFFMLRCVCIFSISSLNMC